MTAPLIALHGFTGSPRAFASLDPTPSWAPVLSGHGSDPDFTAQSFEDEVSRLHRLIELRYEREIRLLAYSMGARVGLGLLLRCPERFSSAMLLGVNPGLESEDARQERLGWEARWIDVLEQDGLAVFEHQWSRQAMFRTQDSIPPKSQDAQRTLRLSHTASGLAHALSVLGLGSMPNYWPRIADLRIPVTVVSGALDEKFLKLGRRFADLSPYATLRVLDGIGHNPLLEAPNAVGALLREDGRT